MSNKETLASGKDEQDKFGDEGEIIIHGEDTDIVQSDIESFKLEDETIIEENETHGDTVGDDVIIE